MKPSNRRWKALFLALVLLLSGCLSQGSGASSEAGRDRSSREGSVSDTSKPGPVESSAESSSAETQKEPEEISVAGLALLSHTVYTVYLEPAENCIPAFDPVYVTMEFENANYCFLTYEGKTIELGRYNNNKYIDLFSMSSDPDEALMINGKCDTDCTGADFAVRVSGFMQGKKALSVFGEQAAPDDDVVELVDREPEEPVVFKAGRQTISQNDTYNVLFTPDEGCDKQFDPFILPVRFYSELGVYFVTEQYKNVSKVFPMTYYREDSGWMEFNTNSGSFWGMMGAGTGGADLTFRVVGLEKNPANMFKNVTDAPMPEPEPEPKPESSSEPEPEPIKPAAYDTKMYYYYGLLNEEQKIAYTQISEALNACEDMVELAVPVSNNEFNRIFWYVLYDQPQIFWTNRNYSVMEYSGGFAKKVRLNYNELANDLAGEQRKVEAVVQSVLKAVKGMTQLETERYVHDFLVKHTVYTAGSPHNQNIYSILVLQETVCAGYARAFQYIMQRIGIPCYYCVGDAGSGENRGRHAWNVIQINGTWYNVDATWDDCYGEQDRVYSYIAYEFYNVTDTFLSVDHARTDYGQMLPACTGTKDSFEKVYGHHWSEEVAKANKISAVGSIQDYFSLCYDELKKTGIGTVTTSFIVTNDATLKRMLEQKDTKEFREAYWYPVAKDLNLSGTTYTYKWSYYGLTSRGGCYYIALEQKIARN